MLRGLGVISMFLAGIAVVFLYGTAIFVRYVVFKRIQALVAPLTLQVDSSFRRMRLPDKTISARQTLFSRDA